MSIRIASIAVLAALLAPSAQAVVPASARVHLQELTPYTGRATEVDPARLPEGVAGRVPIREGEPFTLEVEAGRYSGRDSRSVTAALAEILPAVGFRGDVEALRATAEATLPALDAGAVAREREMDQAALEAELRERFGRVGEVTAYALDLQGDDAEARLSASHTVLRYPQSVDGLVVEGLGVAVVIDGEGSIVRVAGALVNDPTIDRMAVGAKRAAEIARDHLGRETDVRSVETEAAAVATGSALRGVYNVEADTRAGPYLVRVDGATGEVLAVEALAMTYAPAQGNAFTPSPDGKLESHGFEVNDAVDGEFVLAHDQYLTVTTVGADGCDTTPFTVSGTDLADFTMSGDEVEDPTDFFYNCRFQEVNVFVKLQEAIYSFEQNGTQPIPVLTVEVDDDDVCDQYGMDNACASGNSLSFGIGSATLNGNYADGALMNTALDETIILHELGHVVNRQQYAVSGGTINSSVNEGLADYWPSVMLETLTFGEYSGQNQYWPVQSGMLPRAFDGEDVFPDHFVDGGNEAHANGQMLGWALTNVREGIVRRSPLGAKVADDLLLDAMTTSGIGMSKSTKTARIYAAFQDLLVNMLVSAGNTQERVDVLQGFARAGIFTSRRESVVDISDDFLSKNDAPPTFTVWGGEDFYIDGEDVIDLLPQHNACFQVEIANDEAFTENRVTSAEVCGMPSATGGNRRGTWTPTAAEWDQVNDGALVYYRAWTRQPDGSSERRSDRTMAVFMPVPVARAVINEGSGSSCDTTGNGAGAVGLLAGLALLARRKR